MDLNDHFVPNGVVQELHWVEVLGPEILCPPVVDFLQAGRRIQKCILFEIQCLSQVVMSQSFEGCVGPP